ncbi:flotillin family protein [Aneurinibacillus aneurinilyticus]|jgi:flotillin|uniref:SPFH/Band 7/PHB domain protein n=2 Tax=Aneurinibacillus aneurinilyticus TaxID=1391 RepID=U1Y3X4_ANEAE|nr:flotillin family protein [Aneurinibacillus aneurinilyticus]ERI05621.1 SPFH/Band 7/PHB domain protein [Aneurinibacillus aneurinilyticus ATCC 12856]MCI1696086.1 flotillin family protein [Aneurinibacillus aneurinilyticus]MED0672838.1 flotillin family protein [Aneurinibacillus aneurinilyticus]MED0706250.1 flotillin family protein [Aneurinibacillus aneurinilyticus]MED0724204.1 flotillin family protein [Aneurinibacillus aneurinilyticus]
MLGELGIFAVPIIVVVVLLVLGLAFWARYKTVGPDEAMIVTGTFLGSKSVITDESGRSIKIVRGGGAFILPIFQSAEFISLLSHKLDISTPEVYTEQGVPVMADGVAIIKIGSSIEDVSTAAEQFMGKPIEALKSEAQEVLEGHLRAILGSMTVEEVYRNRDRFAQEVQGVAAKDLKKMGLQIVSFTIKDVRDKHGYLDALGRPRIAAVKRDADIAEAEAVRDSRIKKALAEEEGQKAELLRDTNIAEASKEKELKVASFKKDQDMAKAEADQAYFVQEARSKQSVVEEQMRVELVRKEREIDLEEKEILRREKQYDAEVKKKADADRYAVEQAAEAEKAKRMREADAHKYRIEAEAKAMAEQKRLDGLAIAEAERAKGSAEAEVVRLRGLAEAEAKEKLAEAFQKFGEAAVLDIIVKMLPELASKIAEPMGNIEKLTVVDTGKGDGAARVSNYVTSLMATAPQMVKDVSGLDIEQLVKSLAGRKETSPMTTIQPAEGSSQIHDVFTETDLPDVEVKEKSE